MLIIRSIHHDIDPKWRRERNKGYYTLAFITTGKVSYWLDDRLYRLQKNDMILIPSHVERYGRSDPDAPNRKYTAVFSPEPDSSDNPLPHMKASGPIQAEMPNPAYVEQRFALMYRQWLGKEYLYGERCAAVLSELLILLDQTCALPCVAASYDDRVRIMRDYIVRHFREPLALNQLAEMTGVRPNHATVLFRAGTGTTPVQFLHQIRINAAKDLLDHTDMTITDISFYLGYSDPSHFHRMYKKWMGCAPSASRQDKQNN